jgi:hypothetical protein
VLMILVVGEVVDETGDGGKGVVDEGEGFGAGLDTSCCAFEEFLSF